MSPLHLCLGALGAKSRLVTRTFMADEPLQGNHLGEWVQGDIPTYDIGDDLEFRLNTPPAELVRNLMARNETSKRTDRLAWNLHFTTSKLTSSKGSQMSRSSMRMVVPLVGSRY